MQNVNLPGWCWCSWPVPLAVSLLSFDPSGSSGSTCAECATGADVSFPIVEPWDFPQLPMTIQTWLYISILFDVSNSWKNVWWCFFLDITFKWHAVIQRNPWNFYSAFGTCSGKGLALTPVQLPSMCGTTDRLSAGALGFKDHFGTSFGASFSTTEKTLRCTEFCTIPATAHGLDLTDLTISFQFWFHQIHGRFEKYEEIHIEFVPCNEPRWNMVKLGVLDLFVNISGPLTIFCFFDSSEVPSTRASTVWILWRNIGRKHRQAICLQRSCASPSAASLLQGQRLAKLGGGFKDFFLTPTWGNDPISLVFFKWVETWNHQLVNHWHEKRELT